MKVVIESRHLKTATPYMLRNDGVLLECGDLHPYINYITQNRVSKEIYSLLTNERGEHLKWFYQNTNDYIRGLINRFVSSVITNNYCELDNNLLEYLKSNFNITEVTGLSSSDIEAEFLLLNDETNQMFCRVRTSNMRNGGTNGDTYFRISSTDFNWFDIIWNIVNDNRNFIETVSICTDSQSRGTLLWYSHNGNQIYHMPVNDFLTLSGNPIIESNNPCINKLQKGMTLQEATNFTNPKHIINYFKNQVSYYIEDNFKRGDN